jgi:hypothetical protein
MFKKIEFDKQTKEGHIVHVTSLYLFGRILLYTKNVLVDELVKC